MASHHRAKILEEPLGIGFETSYLHKSLGVSGQWFIDPGQHLTSLQISHQSRLEVEAISQWLREQQLLTS